MANYYITAIDKSLSGAIETLLVHKPYSSGVLYTGERKTKAQVLAMINEGHTFETAVYDHTSTTWNKGSDVHGVPSWFPQYLRTVADNTTADNLGNLLPLYVFP